MLILGAEDVRRILEGRNRTSWPRYAMPMH
jgi:hypothetical protein